MRASVSARGRYPPDCIEDKVFLLKPQSDSILPVDMFFVFAKTLIVFATSCELCIKPTSLFCEKHKNPKNFGIKLDIPKNLGYNYNHGNTNYIITWIAK